MKLLCQSEQEPTKKTHVWTPKEHESIKGEKKESLTMSGSHAHVEAVMGQRLVRSHPLHMGVVIFGRKNVAKKQTASGNRV